MSNHPEEEAAMPYEPEDDESPVSRSRVVEIKNRCEPRLLAIDGVRGVGIGTGDLGDEVILVYVLDNATKRRVPLDVEGVPVRTVVSGEIDAL